MFLCILCFLKPIVRLHFTYAIVIFRELWIEESELLKRSIWNYNISYSNKFMQLFETMVYASLIMFEYLC